MEHGFQADDTLVIVTALDGPRLIGTSAGYSPAEDVFYVLADSIASLGSQAVSGGEMVLVLAPMAAKNLANAGYSKSGVRNELMRRATRSVREMKRRVALPAEHPAHWNKIVDASDDNARVPFVRTPENLIILVAGGWGSGAAFSSLCVGWGAHGGLTVKRRVQFPAA